jgi:hypothetical protein
VGNNRVQDNIGAKLKIAFCLEGGLIYIGGPPWVPVVAVPKEARHMNPIFLWNHSRGREGLLAVFSNTKRFREGGLI